ncbi:uncharacterized protein [Anoplolepis gracilipes]|uniref:uncharacterized protein n=1 Tax=Anoplolepis gracilipes TaxID=354296 RepID=UPI003B9FED67
MSPQIGRGLLNRAINALPIELHIPGYQFCDPGTRLEKRLARGDRGINPLDAACREHDISISLKRRAIRILSRRYALTTTEFNFLEIGINVGTPSYVEIVIGDHQGKELVLSLETWKGLYEQRRNIHDLLRKDSKDTYNFISVGPLTVRVHTINDTKLISLESLNVRMMMIEPTLHRMFNLDQCIDVTFDRLVRITETVDTKFTQFSNIASTITDNKKVSNVICASDAFNKHQLVDCELVALVFSHNM